MIQRGPGGLSYEVMVNGADCSDVPALDRGLAYGDGVFRTLAVAGGAPLHWERQYGKLAGDCVRLALPAPQRETLRSEVEQVSARLRDAAVKIIVTRGAGERGYRYGRSAVPSRIVMAAPLPVHPPEYSSGGVAARLCTLRLAHQPALAGTKHLNRLENVLARAEWSDTETAEGILCDAEDNVVSGTMSNVFVAHGDRLSTPDLTRCGVAGVTRDRILVSAAHDQVRCEVRHIGRHELENASEIFFVNSVIGVWPVAVLQGRRYGAGPWARTAQRWLAQDSDGAPV